jgi:hypothetical protein
MKKSELRKVIKEEISSMIGEATSISTWPDDEIIGIFNQLKDKSSNIYKRFEEEMKKRNLTIQNDQDITDMEDSYGGKRPDNMNENNNTMKKSELKRIIKNELIKEGFEGFNGVISLGATNKINSLDEMYGMYPDDPVYGNKDWGDKKTTSEPNDQDIAEVIEDALDKIEDMGMDIGENAREVSEMFNRAIAARS